MSLLDTLGRSAATATTVVVDARFVAALCALVCAESVCRHRSPDSLARPSNAIGRVAELVRAAAYRVGGGVARVTDVCYFVREIIGQDVLNIVRAFARLARGPLYFFRGYFAYYFDLSTTQPIVGFSISLFLLNAALSLSRASARSMIAANGLIGLFGCIGYAWTVVARQRREYATAAAAAAGGYNGAQPRVVLARYRREDAPDDDDGDRGDRPPDDSDRLGVD